MKKTYEAASAELLIAEDELLNSDINMSPEQGGGGTDLPEDEF